MDYRMLDLDELQDQHFVAIGFPIGMIVSQKEADPLTSTEPLYWIRCGDKFHGVRPTAMMIWLRATIPVTGGEIEQYLYENGLSESSETLSAYIKELIEGRLMIPFYRNRVPDELWSMRVIAQGLGLGVNPEDSREYFIAHYDGRPVAGLDIAAYILWMYFDGERTLMQAVKDAAVFLQLDESHLAGRIPPLLEILLKTRSIYFDFPSLSSTAKDMNSVKRFFLGSTPDEFKSN